MVRPLLNEYLLKNVFFDTCAYHQPGAELLAMAKPVENILFVSETIGAVQGIDPETDHYYETTRGATSTPSSG
jgi:4-oxalmesaconate hydratase